MPTRSFPVGARSARTVSIGKILARRYDPGLRPGEAGARRVALAAFLRVRRSGGGPAIERDARRLCREEGAEDADRAAAGARWHVEHERREEILPGKQDRGVFSG